MYPIPSIVKSKHFSQYCLFFIRNKTPLGFLRKLNNEQISLSLEVGTNWEMRKNQNGTQLINEIPSIDP